MNPNVIDAARGLGDCAFPDDAAKTPEERARRVLLTQADFLSEGMVEAGAKEIDFDAFLPIPAYANPVHYMERRRRSKERARYVIAAALQYEAESGK